MAMIQEVLKNLVNWAMVVPSLFPLAGRLETLRRLFPPRYRDWFVVIPCIFSFVVYLYLHLLFTSLPVYIPIGVACLLGAAILVVYILLHFWLYPRYGTLKGLKLGAALVLLLLLFTLFSISLTYSFNLLVLRTEYRVLRGRVLLPDGRPASGANITLQVPKDTGSDNPSGTREEPSETSRRGTFLLILPKKTADQTVTIHIWTDVDGAAMGLVQDWEKLPNGFRSSAEWYTFTLMEKGQ